MRTKVTLFHSLFQVPSEISAEDLSDNGKEAARFSEGFKGAERTIKGAGLRKKPRASGPAVALSELPALT